MAFFTGLRRILAVLTLITACTQKTETTHSSSAKLEAGGEIQLSGNGSGYNGKLHFKDKEDCTRIDVDVSYGTPVAAELSRESCLDITPRPLIIGSEVVVNGDLRSVEYSNLELELTSVPKPTAGVVCRGPSQVSNHSVGIELTPLGSTGEFLAHVTLFNPDLDMMFERFVLTGWSGVHFANLELDNEYLNVSPTNGLHEGSFNFYLSMSAVGDSNINMTLMENGACQ